MNHLEVGQRSLRIHDAALQLAILQRSGSARPIVFLHGFGSTKEDYADIVMHARFDTHPVLAWDAPGCGATSCTHLDRISIPFLVDTALALVDAAGFDCFHLVGHSMGSLTALMLADQIPKRVLSLTSIEGNVSPEDCFLSRQIDAYPSSDAERFFEDFIERTSVTATYASAFYASNLRHRVRAGAVPSIFRSMVQLSDNGGLMNRFLRLPCPKMFMYGEQNNHLSYLSHIAANGVKLARIRNCGHFPMYSNPTEMWANLSEFIVGG